MNLLRTPNALYLQDFLEHFELTLLSILHPRYNSIPAENRMDDTLSLKITDKALYIQHLDRSRTTAMDGGSAGFAGAVQQSIQLIYLVYTDIVAYFLAKRKQHFKGVFKIKQMVILITKQKLIYSGVWIQLANSL